jgi:hypothetical protein
MIDQVQNSVFQVEVVLGDYLLRANFAPLGQMVSYLNDRAWTNVRFADLEIAPLAVNRQVKVINQPAVTIDKQQVVLISLLNPEQIAEVQVLQSKRAAVFYTGRFAIQGLVHVNQDAHVDDLLDGSRDYFPISDVSIFPLQGLAVTPTRRVPLAMINRQQIQLYHALSAPG